MVTGAWCMAIRCMCCLLCSPATNLPLAPVPQLLTDERGRLVELGEGAGAVVYLGQLQGLKVAVKASAAGG